jgi:hypothetical protein
MADVSLNIMNYSRCLCPVCPVQKPSSCIAAKRELWLEARKGIGRVLKQYHVDPGAYVMDFRELEQSEIGVSQGFRRPAPGDMIEVYCSKEVGKSNCDDLNDDQYCQCPDCSVWSDNELQGDYYCQKSVSV